MTPPSRIRCAIYTRKSSEEGLDQSFNSLHAQREACEAYVLSQKHEGWQPIPTLYDDGGFSGGNMERPALRKLLADIAAKKVDTVVVYKVDRLTRSLADFAKIVEQFDKQGISFVSVTQQFNTTTSMGRLTLNVLLSFAQFEREVTGERIRDKIAASKRKGMWMGGVVPLGYDLQDRHLVINPEDAKKLQEIFLAYLKFGCISKLQVHLKQRGILSKKRVSRTGKASGGVAFSRGALYELLHNRIYRGEITHKGASYPGQQAAIIDQKLWDEVQERFKFNMQAPMKRLRLKDANLLMGLLYDGDGNRFTPAHTNKKGKRYRYYISQTLIKNAGKKASGTLRLPALELEELVISQLTDFVQSPQKLSDLFDASRASSHTIVDVARKWTKASAEEVRGLLNIVVERIIVQGEQMAIVLSRSAVREVILGISDSDTLSEGEGHNSLTLTVGFNFIRYKGEMRLQLPPDAPGVKSRTDPSLLRAIARASDWAERLMNGKAANQRAIATETGLNERYISRLLPLAFLAPDLTEAILEGKQSPDLSLETCLGHVPADWAQQRVRLAS